MAVVRSIRFDRNAPVDPAAPTTTHNWYEDPSGVLASGSDIIDNTNGLEQHFIPLLARG